MAVSRHLPGLSLLLLSSAFFGGRHAWTWSLSPSHADPLPGISPTWEGLQGWAANHLRRQFGLQVVSSRPSTSSRASTPPEAAYTLVSTP